jgi:hypothetical protein
MRLHVGDYSSGRRHLILNVITVRGRDRGSLDGGCGLCGGGRYFFIVNTTIARQEFAES